MSEIEPKPCPFCGSSDVDICQEGERADGRPWYVYYVHCNNCVCNGPLIDTSGHDFDTVLDKLADLIDMPDNPTCRNLSNDYRSFHCSRCGYKAFTYCDSDCDPEDFAYCPECRAEVVEDD